MEAEDFGEEEVRLFGVSTREVRGKGAVLGKGPLARLTRIEKRKKEKLTSLRCTRSGSTPKMMPLLRRIERG